MGRSSLSNSTAVTAFSPLPHPEQVGITPEVLGDVTASNMMEEVEPNGDGRISPTNFGWWLSDEGNPNGVGRATAAGFACDSSRIDSVGEDDAQPDEDVMQHDKKVRAGLWGDQLEGQGHIVMRARKLLRLDCFNVNDLLEILAEVAIMVSLVAPTSTPWFKSCV